MKTKNVKVFLSAAIILLIAWAFASCKKSESSTPVSFVALNAEIVVAQNLISTTKEGVAPGDYAAGSQAILQTAITAAQAVAADASATQVSVNAATAQLTAAVTVYQGGIVVALSGLVGQWTFDEVTTATVGAAVADDSGNGHGGTLQAGGAYWSTTAGYPYSTYPAPATNVPTITTDRYGNQHALHFLAGANVDIPYAAALNPSQITITVWAKADTLPDQSGNYAYFANNYMVALNRWNGYKFQLQNSPRAFFTAAFGNGVYDNQDDNVTINGICSKWLQYAVTFTSGSMAFYINGQPTYTWTTSSETGTLELLNGAADTPTGPVDLVFGQDLPTSVYTTASTSDPYYESYGGYFIGSLDDIRIYNTVLTPAQILSIYNLEKP
jgi:hypothetical protein